MKHMVALFRKLRLPNWTPVGAKPALHYALVEEKFDAELRGMQ